MRRPGLVGLVLVLALVAVAPAAARAVTVPHVRGDVNRAYAVLHRDGFRVSIAHAFTLRSDATTVVTQVSPQPGRRLQRGAVVTLRVSCCRRLRRPPRTGANLDNYLPQLRGSSLRQAVGWARTQQRRYRAALAPLHSATGPTLLDDYVVTGQPVPAYRALPAASVLRLAARPGRPAACSLPYYARTVSDDGQAVVYELAGAPGEQEYESDYYGCVRARSVEHRLIRTNVGSVVDTALGSWALSGSRFFAVDSDGLTKYFQGPNTRRILSWDLRTGARTTVYDAGRADVDQLVADPQGFAAWHATTVPASTSTALTGISCPTASFCAASDQKGTVFTSTDPTGGATAWSPTQLPVSQLNDITCPSASLCVAAGNGEVLISTDPSGGAQTWQPASLLDSFTGVACGSTELCVAVGANGIATSTNPADPASWTLGYVSATNLSAVTCPTASFCAASADPGDVVTSPDPAGGASTWSAAQIDDRHLTGIACGSSSLCVTGDVTGKIFSATAPAAGPTAWSVTAQGLDAPGPFTCASEKLCVAAAGQGLYVTTNPTGPASDWVYDALDETYFTGVSCAPKGALCAAVGPYGSITTSTDPTGGPGAWHSASIDALPCLSSGCQTESIMAHDDSGLLTLDTSAPRDGQQLQNLTLAGNTLSWTHNGALTSVTLH